MRQWIRNMSAALVCVASVVAHATPVAEGDDYASVVLLDPWDMSDPSDVFPLLWTHNLASASVAGGVMTGVARDTDPHFWFQFPRIASSILPVNTRQKPIDGNRFNQLAVMMWLPDTIVPGTRSGRLVWHRGGDTVEAFDAAYSESGLFAVYPGWHLYQFDLTALPVLSGSAWSGRLEGLRIDPCLACAVTFKIDWARLYSTSSVGAMLPLSGGANRLVVDTDSSLANGTLATFAADADHKVSLAALPPGRYRVAPITDGDYALAERGDAWDMDTTSDMLWGVMAGFSNTSVSNNQFNGRTVSSDPYVLLDVPAHKPIDAGKYRYLSIDMTLGSVPSQESGLLVWWGAQTATPQHPTAFFPVSAGRQTYRIDLGVSPDWRGMVKALRIDPLNGPNAGSGVQVTLHSVRLTKNPGFIEAVAYSDQPLVINARPHVRIVSPDFDAGEDYAETELGTGWTMAGRGVEQPQFSNLSGWEYTTAIPDLGAVGHFFHATSNPAANGQTEGDPHAFLVYQQNAHPIAADTYRWLGFDLHVPMDAALQSELTTGAMARLAWKSNDVDPGVTSDDIVLMPGLNTYWFDMKALRYEPASPRIWSGNVSYLRIDPFEFSTSRHFYLGRSRLTAIPHGRYVVPVVLDLADADNDALSVEILAGETLLASQSGLTPGRVSLLAGLGALPAGEHVLTARVKDGVNVHEVSAVIPVRKVAPGFPVSTWERGALDRVYNWVEAQLPVLGVATSSAQHSCAVPGAYARRYTGVNACLMGIDGVVVYTLGDNTLRYAGSLKELLAVAGAAGF